MRQNGFVPVVGVVICLVIGIMVIIGVSNVYKVTLNTTQKSSPTLSSPSTSSQFPGPTDSTAPPSPILTTAKTVTLKLYPSAGIDSTVVINKTHVIGLLFSPTDGSKVAKNEWIPNMKLIFNELERFYERQFPESMDITYTSVGSMVNGDLPASSYTPESLAEEAIQKTNQYKKVGQHNMWMIYFVRDEGTTINVSGGSLGGVASQNAATQFEFWLNDEAIGKKGFGTIGSLHEFGHALGIPHPWELPANTSRAPNFGNVAGDIMSYSNSGVSVDTMYIRADVKSAMGWK